MKVILTALLASAAAGLFFRFEVFSHASLQGFLLGMPGSWLTTSTTHASSLVQGTDQF